MKFSLADWCDHPGGSTTTISIEDATDFEAGGKVRISDMNTPTVWETKTISAVDKVNNTITVSVAPTSSYVAGRAGILMRKKYITGQQDSHVHPDH